MNRLHFERDRHIKELLIDSPLVVDMEDVGPVAVVSFFMLMVLEESAGEYHLDGDHFSLGNRMLVFIRPDQVNVIMAAQFKRGYFLFFPNEFLKSSCKTLTSCTNIPFINLRLIHLFANSILGPLKRSRTSPLA